VIHSEKPRSAPSMPRSSAKVTEVVMISLSVY
jgi:hypothetical protein